MNLGSDEKAAPPIQIEEGLLHCFLCIGVEQGRLS